ncbi:MAG TPA: hypothetical protein VGF67_26405 [Ktedonobacteraceae bacterium]|jgi:photosystem II stability/assembly factor-like uncharacterized protein
MTTLSSAPHQVTHDPEMPSPFFRHPGRRLLLLLAMAGLLSAAIFWQSWYQQQTGMIAGRPLASRETHLHAVVFSSRSGVIYLGTHAGLFASTDGGRTWPRSKAALTTMMITAIAVSPTNPDLLAVLSIPNGSSGGQLGVWVSADGGAHWRFTPPASLPASAYPYALESASGAAGHFYAFFTSAGWFETHDLGKHWSPLTYGTLAPMTISSLLVDPANTGHLLIGSDAGLSASKDDGKTWQQITRVQSPVTSLVATQERPDRTRIIFCATDQELLRGIQRQGQILWMPVSLPTSLLPTRLVVNADGSALYALAGSDLWFSANQGSTWSHRWHFARGDLTALTLNPDNVQELLAGFFWPGLALISTDAGLSWRTLTD